MMDITFTQNRELSWLEFNKRVLEEAKDPNVPILERLKFLSIYDTNLEEFFMVRVGSLTDLSKLKKQHIDNKSNMSPNEQLDAIFQKLIPMYRDKDEVFFSLQAELRKEGINLSEFENLSDRDRESLKIYFDTNIEPILSFQVIDRVHPLPRIANLSLSIIYDLEKEKDKKSNEVCGIIYVPEKLDRFVRISENTYVFLEDIIKHLGKDVFEGYKVKNSYIIGLTRNTDISYDDDDYEVDQDFRAYMKSKLKKRKRLQVVRLEVDENLSQKEIEFLCKNFEIEEKSIFYTKSPMQLGFLFSMLEIFSENFVKNHTYDPYDPVPSIMVDPNKKMIDQIYEKDILLSYPYESMDPLLRLLDEASIDPKVDSIKISLYRIAKDSAIANSLIRAAENGKEVIVLMELRARFDENNNILWSSRLEEAGCKVIYGFDHYKCHCKVCLITRIEDNRASFISQIATGNYNEKTAKLYTDFSLMTANQEIGQDAKDLFDNILIGNLNGSYKKLLVAPKSMQEGLEKLINEEIKKAKNGEEAYIRLKMNSISDRKLIDLLSEASNAGVKIDMMVRGICCIVPGIKEKTENIDIYQIVGRFLEHHRVYQFGKTDPKLYISSADFMTRNIRNRMEVGVPILDKNVKKYILDYCDIIFSDDVKIRKLSSDGTYKRIENKNNFDAQEELMKKAKRDFENEKIKIDGTTNANKNKILQSKAKVSSKGKKGILGFLKNIFVKSSK